MKYVLLLSILFSTSAFAQAPPKAKGPTVGGKRLVQVKPTGPQDCKLVGTVKGTKLWSGDCSPVDWKNPLSGTIESPVTGSVTPPDQEKQ
jgi:hypothetical protein